MIIKNVTTVAKMLRMVDLSMLKNRAAENLGKFCKITSLKWVSTSFSWADNILVCLLKTYDFVSIVSASLSIKSHLAITTLVPICKKHFKLSRYFQNIVLTKVSSTKVVSAKILNAISSSEIRVFWKMKSKLLRM
jgi:hypothetical protein